MPISKVIETLVGSFGNKRRWRRYKARREQLPESYRTAFEALERYLMYFGAVANGNIAIAMLEDLADLFEQSVAAGSPVRAIVGEDPVEFAEEFVKNYSEGQWINKERKRLIEAIERAAGEDTGKQEGSL